MQNQYVGDIGDYIKYALLRYITGTNKLGVVWYLHPNQKRKNDGKHTDYLKKSKIWRHYDTALIDELKDIVERGRRSVHEVKTRNIIQAEVSIDDMLCCEENAQKKSYRDDCSSKKEDCRACSSRKDREIWRKAWFDRALEELVGCKIVFADPDNGLCLGEKFRVRQPKYWKRLPLQEGLRLSGGRTAILYHHNTRFKGGHPKEVECWLSELPQKSMALYFNAYSCRTFFIVNPTEDIRNRTQSFAARWSKHVSL